MNQILHVHHGDEDRQWRAHYFISAPVLRVAVVEEEHLDTDDVVGTDLTFLLSQPGTE